MGLMIDTSRRIRREVFELIGSKVEVLLKQYQNCLEWKELNQLTDVRQQLQVQLMALEFTEAGRD